MLIGLIALGIAAPAFSAPKMRLNPHTGKPDYYGIGINDNNIDSADNVSISSVADLDLLQYKSATSKWTNVTVGSILGSLTADRIVYTKAGGLLTTSSKLTYDGSSLTWTPGATDMFLIDGSSTTRTGGNELLNIDGKYDTTNAAQEIVAVSNTLTRNAADTAATVGYDTNISGAACTGGFVGYRGVMTTGNMANGIWSYVFGGETDTTLAATATSNSAVFYAHAPTVSANCNDYGVYISSGYDYAAYLNGLVQVAGIQDSTLTSGRVPYATTNGRLTDNANLTYDGNLLTATGDATVTDLLSYDEADWTGGNVIYVPLTTGTSMEDAINAAITVATAGDTLVLAAGTWVIDGAVVCGKKVHLKGQGRGITTIYSTSDHSMIINSATAGTLISDMTISHAGAVTGSTRSMVSLSFAANINNVEFLNAATGSNLVSYNCVGDPGGGTAGTSNIENCTFTCTGEVGVHRAVYCGVTGSTINVKNCVGTSNAITSPYVGYGSGLIATNIASTINLYNCNFTNPTNTTSGVIHIYGAAASSIKLYNCYINGSGATGFDVKNESGSATLTLSNCTLANNTTSGTISYVNPTSIAKSGNIYYSYTNEDLDALIASAKITAGDTIVLGTGTYTITDDIDVTKAINIVGQGKWTGTSGVGTLVNCATASKNCFDISADNVRIANLSITNSGGSGKGITAGTNKSGLVFTNLDITMSGAGSNYPIFLASCDATVRDCVLTGSSSDNSVYGLYHTNSTGNTGDRTVNVYNTYSTMAGGGSGNSIGFGVYNANDDNFVRLNLYNCQGLGAATSGAADCGVRVASTTTANAHVYAYGCYFSGVDYDVINVGVAGCVLSLSDCTLINGTSSGTITMSGTIKTANAHVAGSITTRTLNFAADAQASDDYVITLSPAPTAYTTGMPIYFTANTANTGACTVNVNGLGAKSLKSLHDQDPADSYIEAGSVVHAVYDGTNFQIMNPDANP